MAYPEPAPGPPGKARSLWSAVDLVEAGLVNLTWPNANEAFYIRVRNRKLFTPSHAFLNLGTAAAAGNIDIAVSDVDFNLIGSTGSFAMVGTQLVQFEAFTTPIPEGEIVMSLALSSAAGSVRAAIVTSVNNPGQARASEAAQQLAAFPLPDPAVPANPTDFFGSIPLFGFVDLLV